MLPLAQALLEPVHALRAAAVGERFGHHDALRLSLQRVVADARGGIQPFLDVAGLQPGLGLLRVVGPYAGQAVGLQFQAHRQRVHLLFGHAAAHAVDLGGDAQQPLHMVADLVRDHVGLRKVARRTEPPGQRVEETQVDVDLLVGRAVERAHRRLALAAGGARRAAEQHQPRRLVGTPGGAELCGPDVLGAGQHRGHEARDLVIGRRRLCRSLLRTGRDRRRRRHPARPAGSAG